MTRKHADVATSKSATESYLLNIYHSQGQHRDTALVGTVEKLGNEEKCSFHDIQELLHLLGIDNFKSGGVGQ